MTAAIKGRLNHFKKWLGGSYTPYLFILPFFVMFFAFGLYPILYSFRMSFMYWHGAGEARFIGLDNYIFLFTDNFFWTSILNTVVLWLLIVPLQTLFGVLAAAMLSAPRLKLRSFFRTVFLTPYLVPVIAIAQVWLILFDADFGAINNILQTFNLPAVAWLRETAWTKPTMALMVFWKYSGFATLIMLAAIQSIPLEVYEAAELDGAGSFRQFIHITVPLMRRSIAFFMVMSTLWVLQMFAEPFVLTEGGPFNSTMTAGFFLYRYIKNLDIGTGSANSFVLMVIMFIVSLLMIRMFRADEEN